MAMRKRNWLLIVLICLVLIQASNLSAALGSNASSGTSDWSMFRQNPNHTGLATANSSVNSAEVLWNYTTGRMVQSSPAIADGCVFVGSRDSQVYCLNASNGEPIWKYAFHYEVWSSPAVYNNRVYLGTDDGNVYCLNITTGTPLWKSQIGGAVRSSPAVADGCVYIGSGDHDVFCLNATDGSTIWKFPTLTSVESSPAYSGRSCVRCHWRQLHLRNQRVNRQRAMEPHQLKAPSVPPPFPMVMST